MGKNLENEEWREEAPTLSGMPVRDVFSVPQNYFENLSASIEAKVAVDRLKVFSTEQAFTVPSGYFDRMKEEVLSKAKSPSKVLKLWRSNVLKYASAACFVLIAGLGVYFNQEQPQSSVNYVEIANEQMLFDIDEDVIIEHIQGTDQVAMPLSADQSDLENYILTNFSSRELTAEY
ncbi:hypothetical protein [Pedobacter sp. JCM 36344]|uniref:hypothetical protein n=1 Tax=Pedobacter sp. JCM 36344 TaxID=3374280 RepID=UPI00397C507F